MPRQNRHRSAPLRVEMCPGFTLIELLVAGALTVLIAGVLMGMSGTAVTNWARSHGTLTAENQARLALNSLERDWESALSREDGNVWLVATIQPDASASGVWVGGTKPSAESLNQVSANLADARFGLAGVWMRFFTTARIAPSDELTAPVAVSYQIVRRPPSLADSSSHYLLYRTEVTAAATQSAGYDLSASAYTVASDVAGEPGTVVRPDRQDVLADHVIDLGIRLYAYRPDAESGGITLQPVFPVDAANLEYRAQSPLEPAGSTQPFPAVVEVLIRVLTDEGARRIAALEAGQLGGDWWTIASAHSKVFVRRIQVRAPAR